MTFRTQPKKSYILGRIFRKFCLSAFVVGSFVLYATHKPFSAADSALDGSAPAAVAQVIVPELTPGEPAAVGPTPLNPTATTVDPTATPQALIPTRLPPTPTTVSAGQYKDGTYKGSQVDAFYGLVQVQTTIRNGKIASVQFLLYPSDRRTSVRINSFAVPTLQQEAVQAQSANVHIITGATLTSEAFMRSLQSALSSARS